MIDMHSKYDNMHKNGMFCALICINNLIIACINYMLSRHQRYIVNGLSYFDYDLRIPSHEIFKISYVGYGMKFMKMTV